MKLRRLAGSSLAIGSLVVVAGCGTHAAGGDPGGRRLNELAADPVFAAVPHGAARVRTTKTPAKYSDPGFTGGGWHGPSVVVTIRSAGSTADVYRFYRERAASSGWHATAKGALGLVDRWSKSYPDGAAATLDLTPTNATQGLYRLTGSIAPVSS